MALPPWADSLAESNPVVFFDIEVTLQSGRIIQLGRIEMLLAADVVPNT